MAKKSKHTLFEVSEPLEEHWQGMPEYNQKDREPWKTIPIHFENEDDMKSFAKLIDRTITRHTRSLWYPKPEVRHYMNKRYISKTPLSKSKEKINES